MSRYVVEERDDEFVLPLAGYLCSGLEDGVEAGGGVVHVDLILHNDDFTERSFVRVAGDDLRITIVSLVARRARVLRIVSTLDSSLLAEFDGNDSFENPSGEYEAWEVQGPGPVHVVAPAGGGEPAVWDATTERRTIRPGDPLPPDVERAIAEFGLPRPTGEFELRRSKRGHFELGPPREED